MMGERKNKDMRWVCMFKIYSLEDTSLVWETSCTVYKQNLSGEVQMSLGNTEINEINRTCAHRKDLND